MAADTRRLSRPTAVPTVETVKDRLSDLVDNMCERADQRFDDPEAQIIEALLSRYYATVAPDDLDGRDVDDLYGAALCHRQLARHRQPDEPNIRVYTPVIGEDGWQTPHSVVDIVTTDKPFLVDSVMSALETRGLAIHLLAHPVIEALRDEAGILTAVEPRGEDTEAATESLIHVEIDRIDNDDELDRLADELRSVLRDVGAANRDWPAMRARAIEIAAELDTPVATVSDTDRAEARDLLTFLADDQFTFLGYRQYDLHGGVLSSVDTTGLGILADAPSSRRALSNLPPEAADRATAPTLLNLTKANAKSTVHRAVRLDYIGIKRLDADGCVIGEHRFLGLYTSRIYAMSATEIPVIRHKVAEIQERSGDKASSHDRAAIRAILETYPRDELFDADVDDLARIAQGILHLRERRRLKLFARPDRFGRYVSCLVFVPRDRYNTETRHRIQDLLMEAYEASECEFDSQVSGDVLARAHLTIFLPRDGAPEVDLDALEHRIEHITRGWEDHLQVALVERHGEALALELAHQFADAFPVAYRDDTRPAVAVDDIDRMRNLDGDGLSVNLYRPLETDGRTLRFKLFRAGEPVALTDVLPLLHDLGLAVTDERPYEIDAAGLHGWIYDFGLRLPHGLDVHHTAGVAFERAFLAAWEGHTDSDGFHHLVLSAGLDWREVQVLRAYRHYLRQIGSTFSQAYYERTLQSHTRLVQLLVDCFRARFDPDLTEDRETAVDKSRAELDAELDLIPSLDEDRMLRSFASLIAATVRTNHYQRDADGRPPGQLAIKLDPTSIPGLPLPHPVHEVFVYSPAVEGVHLRSGDVARGGLRWSDRLEDYRTEVLGLMKAQMVKNAVIVPTGAKGGFVAKRLTQSMSREETRTEVTSAYHSFVSGLLDVTDNLLEDQAVHPERVICHDGPDPYLVVAADRGTATLSDTANRIARERGFWLDDAFASGGSTGYDHKAMGITARGAWESVKRHFHELGVGLDTEPFTAVGIGDMSGDVFGNGIQQSRQIRLIGAFDHRHVFVDPNPDPDSSFDERQRLFELPGSSWADYDPQLISQGGGVFERSAKAVPLPDEMRAALGLGDTEVSTPDELVRHLLTAPVDLIWNGGIGTFVKSSTQTNADADDRGNDSTRVDASELRCRVIGEGGNLGLTQPARIEFAMLGGKVFSDAVDNAAGVNCSDHEVNIKILLNGVVADGDLTVKQRNVLLAEMTDDVSDLVLQSNYNQTTALSAARAQAPGMVGVHQRHLAWLEREIGLDRRLEALPSDEDLNERREDDTGLTPPELSVLMAFTKIAIAGDLLSSDLPEDLRCRELLEGYFPSVLQERYPTRIERHPLARELIATIVTNRLVDRAGLSMAHRLAEETSAPLADIARAHLAAWQLFDLDDAWTTVDQLGPAVASEVELLIRLEIKRLGERATRWLLRNRPLPLDIESAVERYDTDVEDLAAMLSGVLRGADHEAVEKTRVLIAGEGVPPDLSNTMSSMGLLFSALDVSELRRRTGASFEVAAGVYFALKDDLELGWLRDRIIGLPRNDRWESLARSALRDDFYRAHTDLTASVLVSDDAPHDPDALIQSWIDARPRAVQHCLGVLGDIRATGRGDLAQLSVGLRELRNLIHVAHRETGHSSTWFERPSEVRPV